MPRKGRFEFDPDNTTADGHYIVGKNRPPEKGKFRPGDGRPRGRRPKGTRNLTSDLREELNGLVTVTVAGEKKRVSRQRAIVMRLADNAVKGQNPAIAMTLEYQQRLVEPLLAVEQERAADEVYDYKLLTLDEMRAMEYFLAKASGQKLPDRIPQIIMKRSACA